MTWFKCSENLPQLKAVNSNGIFSQRCLFIDSLNDTFVGYFNFKNKKWESPYVATDCIKYPIKYWMPLPGLPNELD